MRKVIKFMENIPLIGKSLALLVGKLILALWFYPPTSRFMNRIMTNGLATLTNPRPRPFSLWSHEQPPSNSVNDYTAWASLTNKHFSSRHLRPASQKPGAMLPAMADLLKLFERTAPMQQDRNSLLFMFFAQWLTDSVLRTDQADRRKNTSNHEVDLCQIYGLNETMTNLLRTKSDGKLKYNEVLVNGITEHYPERLYEKNGAGGWRVKKIYADLMQPQAGECLTPEGKYLIEFVATQEKFLGRFQNSDWRKEHIYLTGLDNGNSSIGYVVFSTLFLREHNRICDLLINTYKKCPEWQFSNKAYFDERVFQTARLINIGLMLKLTLEEYINHISGVANFRLDTQFAEKESWYRPNWITLEFNLLYRWHSMIPETITLQKNHAQEEYRFNNGLFETAGLDAVISALSKQTAGKICLQNTPGFMLPAEQAGLQMARDFKLDSYNAYRKKFDLDPIKDFAELTTDPEIAQQLKALYNEDINAVEFLPGLFAETAKPGKLFGELLVNMISYDALTQIYTNPLLSENIFNADTLTAIGLDIIHNTHSFQDLALRNSTGKQVAASFKAPLSQAPQTPRVSSGIATPQPTV